MENELLYTVRSIFKSYLSEKGKEYYNIPEYQRGYKWNGRNVTTLLNDLKNYEKSNPSEESFYCLQNITIVPFETQKGNHYYNVVDGQQRLTTLYIILSYLRSKEKIVFDFPTNCLQYSVREETKKMLLTKISNGSIWNNPIYPDTAKFKDQWYILDVAKSIQIWFEGSESSSPNDLKPKTILDHTQFIVNEMQQGNETSIFAGLNGGKVDLDGADLVRAELITRAAREKFGAIDAHKVGEFRAHIGLELDSISRWWNDNSHQLFFSQMLPDKEEANDFSPSCKINTLYRLYYHAYRKENDEFGFRFFENGRDFNNIEGDNHWEFYDSLTIMHKTLKDWFESPALFHWIGYLFFNYKNMKDVTFENIWNLWLEKGDKYDFLTKIKQRIIRHILELPTGIPSSDKKYIDAIKNLISDVSAADYDWYHDDRLDKILILIELLWLEENNYKNILNVENLRQYEEQREHIRSCQPNKKEGEACRDKQEWISFINKAYNNKDDIGMHSELLKLLTSFGEGNDLTEENINAINLRMNKYAQNCIGNMVLLHKHINMSYGNALYREKVERVILEFMNSKWYVRPYTFNIFLKKIEDSDKEWRWTNKNIKDTAIKSSELLSNFLKQK